MATTTRPAVRVIRVFRTKDAALNSAREYASLTPEQDLGWAVVRVVRNRWLVVRDFVETDEGVPFHVSEHAQVIEV